MNFEPNEEQAEILSALARITSPYKSLKPSEVVQRTIYAKALERSLTEAGFLELDIANNTDRTTAALIVAELAKLPVCLEAMATLLVRPRMCPKPPGPVALIWGDSRTPTRFLPQAKTAIVADDDGMFCIELQPDDVEEVAALFAYPIGRLRGGVMKRAAPIVVNGTEDLRQWWRVGIALEIYGALDSAAALTLDHVTQRKQFGQPLGALQAIQHRLAMNATTIQAIRWLALSAASTGATADAAMAAGYAQQAVSTVVYDLHQFSGAMGLTLEYPLHLYTYRARMLQSELGGARRQYAVSVADTWADGVERAALSA